MILNSRSALYRNEECKMNTDKDQGGAEFQSAGMLKYVEDLKRGPNAEIYPSSGGLGQKTFLRLLLFNIQSYYGFAYHRYFF